MVFEHIEKLKQEFTDKFVIVDEGRPELRRFSGLTGTVKTVNMSGRALVEFDGRNNIGWFDIEIDYLKVIDQPLAKKDTPRDKTVATKKSAKPASTKPSALEQARAADGAKKAAAMSVNDVLAAARGQQGGGDAGKSEKAAAPAAKDPKSMSVADVLAAARGKKGDDAPPAASSDASDVAAILEAARKPVAAAKATAPAAASASQATAKDPKAMSVAEILAAARGGAAATSPPETESVEADTPAEQPAEPTVAAEEPAPSAPDPVGELPTDVAGIIEFCRQRDGG